eukprot:TRINITY_DN1102_c0_g1_i4.p1 TRINITY_DN1102_c0_g1~~TRINITY_DN1102_c0_g1_i4.p1  ORF type:complete len:637 (-),score=164.77 TRINITY_DN1102_c0_g1_i4:1888-3798(-)
MVSSVVHFSFGSPHLTATADHVEGSRVNGGCRTLSGTSVAAPVVTGIVTLIASSLVVDGRANLINPAAMKQIVMDSAELLPGRNIFEQGAGRVNLMNSYYIAQNFQPHVSLLPDALDFTDCPYMWPYCTQPLYFTSVPVTVNVTILNSITVSSHIDEIAWKAGHNGDLLELSFTYPHDIWPWSGWIGVRVRATAEAADFSGTAEGEIRIRTSAASGGAGRLQEEAVLPFRIPIVPTPPRHRRLLWDQYHSLQYPPGFFPRDVLTDVPNEQFDWNGDHPHTNMRELYAHLRGLGYFVDVLGEPLTCFDANNYGALLLVDPEDDFSPQDVEKLHDDVDNRGLSLLVFADWFNVDIMEKFKFFDTNSKTWWHPQTGGANVPAINNILQPWGVAFGSTVFNGVFKVGANTARFLSGNAIARFPAGGALVSAELVDALTDATADVPVLGLYRTDGGGSLVVFGDSSCLDSALRQTPSCLWLAERALAFANGTLDHTDFDVEPRQRAYSSGQLPTPPRRGDGAPAFVSRTVVHQPCTHHVWSKPAAFDPDFHVDVPLRTLLYPHAATMQSQPQQPQQSPQLQRPAVDAAAATKTVPATKDEGSFYSHLVLYLLCVTVIIALASVVIFNRWATPTADLDTDGV